jgi:hypothetical protein
MAMTALDRRRLWGKSGNRCASCHRLLTEPGGEGAQEIAVGEEAHIVGARPGSARYRPLQERERHAYENRILLCPTDHTIIDGQSPLWTVPALLALKQAHEETMTSRTADTRPDGLRYDMPGAVPLDPIIGGRQLLNIVGPAHAYLFDDDPMEAQDEREAAKELLGNAHDCGEIFSMLGVAEQLELADSLSGSLRTAVALGLVLYGALIDVDVAQADWRDRWPIGILRLRRMEVVAEEQARATASR